MSEPVDPVAAERNRRRRGRNLAVFFALLAFVVIVYGVTITKIKMGYGP
ncbi:MAG TPA: hypothetical protein VFR09_07020 [Alphaproteobacteria bacterium]|nr:hypothetical protein [Alphaproteobacteria bacterium]